MYYERIALISPVYSQPYADNIPDGLGHIVESRFAFEMFGLADVLRSLKRKNEDGYAI